MLARVSPITVQPGTRHEPNCKALPAESEPFSYDKGEWTMVENELTIELLLAEFQWEWKLDMNIEMSHACSC